MDMGYDQEPVLPALITVPPQSRYPLRSRHNSVTPFLCKLLPLPMNEFTSAPAAVIASISASDIDRNSSVTVTFSGDPFGQSFPETINVSGIHPTLGLVLHYYVDRHHCQLLKMDLGTPSHRLPQWKSRLRSAYIFPIYTMSVHTIADIDLVISAARAVGRPYIVVVFTKDDAPNCLSAVGLPQLYFDQLRIMKRHIDNTVLAFVHKAITGPKFNRRTLQKQLDWNDWIAAEWIHWTTTTSKQCLELLVLHLSMLQFSIGFGCILFKPWQRGADIIVFNVHHHHGGVLGGEGAVD
jgi:hypothetical protein